MSKYDTLNKEQQEAVYHTEGPVLILAGAGSGKTRVLTHRIAYLIEEKGVNPWHIMAITFTNKAASEMRERVDKIVGFGSESIWVSTFHSSCVRILRRFIERLGYGTNFTIYDTDDQKTVIKDVCKRLEVDGKIFKERGLMNTISRAKDELISPEEFKRKAQASGDWGDQTRAKVYEAYQRQLRQNNALDFDDLIMKTVELFMEHPDVLEYYQERFQYIMVDEYQDTNTAQFKFISLLAGKYKNLCVVGDDDQSIYKFRGANIGNILGYERVFPDAKVIKLEQNYRSTKNILNAANGVIRNNVGRKEKRLWTENEKGAPVHFQQFYNGFEEAEYIAGDISRKVREGTYEYKDCAILYRTNAQSRLFEEKFLIANIPYKIVGGVNFYARKEIKDLLAYLKTIDNGRDEVAVKRIINVPKRGIGAASLDKIQFFASERDMSLYQALKDPEAQAKTGRTGSKIQGFVDFIQKFRSQVEFLSVSELLEKLIEETGYVAELEAEDTDEARARIENIDELISKAASYESETEHPDLSGFLEEVALIADIDSVNESDNKVLLMTLHSAKGLEFPNVYMAGMEDGLFPSYMTIMGDDPEEMEEERRLCYVGITRAMENLTLTAAQQRMIRGETQFSRISRFLKEIPDSTVDSKHGGFERKEAPAPKVQSSYAMNRQSYRKSSFQARPVQVKKAQGLDYTVGDTVKHMKFGKGVVTDIVDGGRDYEVTVDFEKAGVKKMFASFAKLKKI